MKRPAHKILVYDDNETDFIILKKLFSTLENSADYKLDWSGTSAKTLDMLKKNEHDLLILDYSLGAVNGLDFMRGMHKSLIQIPVVMLTGNDDEEVDRLAIQEGVMDYLVKDDLTKKQLDRCLKRTFERRKQIEDLVRAATFDTLTCLYNRGHIVDLLKKQLGLAKRYKFPLSVSLCDIDNFKNINDRYGHQDGDQALKEFGRLVLKNIRNEDMAARFGGDEFFIIFPHVRADAAAICLERIRENYLAHRFLTFKNGDLTTFQATASFGIVTLQSDWDYRQLVNEADKALYRAKEQGRNCVVTN